MAALRGDKGKDSPSSAMGLLLCVGCTCLQAAFACDNRHGGRGYVLSLQVSHVSAFKLCP